MALQRASKNNCFLNRGTQYYCGEVHISPSDLSLNLNSVGGGGVSGYRQDIENAQEVAITTSGSLGESEVGGPVINVVPRTGGLSIAWVARALSGSPFTIFDSRVDADRNGTLLSRTQRYSPSARRSRYSSVNGRRASTASICGTRSPGCCSRWPRSGACGERPSDA